ncbi:MAG: hypothetical protein GTN78_07040 [Gemmatimonadales bacterium]|nr:hypothetical protein [Gemmatimonadales bacterium]NIQ99945.1 hypothetical protein [Gemmatimonadales bacterium]NIS64404.1 hypothetical protein [Gemmatimonadales bacterium]
MTVLDLADFPQQRFGAAPLPDWTEVGIVAAVLAALSLIPVMLGIRVLGMFVG